MLRRKLRNNTILMRTAILEGLFAVCWPLPPEGRSVLYISMINDATMDENRVFCEVIVRQHDVNAELVMRVALTKITIELVLPIRLSTNSLSLICASDEYSFQYEADVSPYLHAGALITLSQRSKFL
jgi:hypothetical protein